ncbi:MAG: thermonuclease family protein [Caldilineaceae bacterium]|nr:thermonuclease family protein [Caldilineaceae bacterium]
MDAEIVSQLLRVLVTILLLVGFGVVILISVGWATRPNQGIKPTMSSVRTAEAEEEENEDSALIPGQPVRLRSRLYYYAAHVTSVYDGDTITVDVDLGLGVWRHNQSIRLWKINAPEVRGAEREQGLKVRDFVRSQILDKQILLRTILDKRGVDQTEKFGRMLGEILVEDESGTVFNLNELLLERGMALPMDEKGSMVSAESRSISVPPDRIACPFCGQIRAVDQDTAQMRLCPNCLDPARSVF